MPIRAPLPKVHGFLCGDLLWNFTPGIEHDEDGETSLNERRYSFDQLVRIFLKIVTYSGKRSLADF